MVKNKLRIIKFLYSALVLLFFGGGTLLAQTSIYMDNNTPSNPVQGQLNNTGQIALKITAGSFSNFQFTVVFDSTKISVDGIDQTGTLTGGQAISYKANPTDGRINVAFASASTVSGPGTLLYLNVTYKGTGVSTISLANAQLGGSALAVTNPIGYVSVSSLFIKFKTFTTADNILVGQTINIPVQLNAAITSQGVTWYSFSFSYIPTDLRFLSTAIVTDQSAFLGNTISAGGVAVNVDTVAGTGTVAFNGTTSTTTPDPLLLLNLRAVVKKRIPGTPTLSPLTITNVTFGNGGGPMSPSPTTQLGYMVTKNQLPTITIPAVTSVPPAISVKEAAPISLQVVGNSPDGVPFTITSSALPTSAIAAGAFTTVNATTKLFTWTPDFTQQTPAGSPKNMTFTLTETDGLTSPQSIGLAITVTDSNRVPTGVLFDSSAYHVNQGSAVNIKLRGQDADLAEANESLVFAYTTISAPAGAAAVTGTITNNTKILGGDSLATFTWTTPYLQTPGTYVLGFTATDLAGKVSTPASQITIVVNSVNNPPVWDKTLGAAYLPSSVFIREGMTTKFRYIAIDPEGQPLQYTKLLNPIVSWITLDQTTGWVTITPPAGTAGNSIQLNVGASDGTNNTVLSPIALISVAADTKPIVNLNPSGNQSTIETISAIPIVVTTNDVDTNPVDSVKLTYTTNLPAGQYSFTAAPGQFAGGTLTFTPLLGTAGKYYVTFTGTDLSGLSTSSTDTIIVLSAKKLSVGKIAKQDGTVGAVGDVVYIPIVVDPTTPLSTLDQISSYQFAMSYNKNVLNVINITGFQVAGTISSNPGYNVQIAADNTAGTGNLAFVNGQNYVTGSGTLIYVLARVVGVGISQFNVTAFKFNNQNPPATTSFGGADTVANRLPVLTALPAVSGKEASVVTFTAQAVDPDNTAITYSTNAATVITGTSLVAPAINAATGVFTWTPGWLQAGSYTLNVTATDADGGTDMKTVTITVADSNRAPVIASFNPAVPVVGYYEVNLLSSLTIQVNASDPDADNTISFSLQGAPANASINPTTGQFLFTPSPSQTGTYSGIIVVVTDSKGLSTKSAAFTIKVNTQAPSFTLFGAQQLPSLGTQLREGQVMSFKYIAIDPQNLPLTYYLIQPSPGFCTIDPNTGVLTMKPVIGTASSSLYQIVVLASNGISSTTSNIAYVKILSDAAPVVLISGPVNISVAEEGNVNFVVTTTDADAGDSVKLAMTSIAAMTNSTFTPNNTTAFQGGTFNWTPALGKAGSYSVTFTGTDLSGVTSTPVVVNITVTKHNYAPVFTDTLSSQTVAAGTAITYTYKATDKNGDPLTFSVITPASAQINATTGAFTYTAVTPGTIPVTIQVTDGTTPVQTTANITVTGYSISGTFTYANSSAKLISNVTVSLKKADGTVAAPSVVTTATGSYTFSNLPPASYVLSYLKPTDDWGGITSADALAIARYYAFAGNPSYPSDQLSAVQLLAADVNNSGSVNNTDALAVLQRYVGLITSFKDGAGNVLSDWVFKSTLGEAVTVTTANIVNNVSVLATGDVNKSLYLTLQKSNAQALNSSVKKVNAKSTFEIPVSANMLENLGSISLKMSYPVELAKFEGLVANQGLGQVMTKSNAADGTISIAWADMSAENTGLKLNDKSVLFTLKFTATDKFQKGSNFELTMDASSEITTTSGKVIDKSNINAPSVEVSVPEVFNLKQNYPNPFNPSTTIAYDMPVSGHVSIVVFNILGQQVATVLDLVQEAGSYKVQWDASKLTSGVYIYQLTVEGASQKYTKANRMILMK